MQLDEATDNFLGCNLEASEQRLVQQLGCFGGLGARPLSRGVRADAVQWATWDLHAPVFPQLAAELGRPVTEVAVVGVGGHSFKAKCDSQTHRDCGTSVRELALAPGDRRRRNPGSQH